MFIFVDESGVHKSIDYSTFVLVYIKIKNYSLVENKIKEIESKLKIDYFYWSETVWKVKEKY